MTKTELEARVGELEQEVADYKASLAFMCRLANTLMSLTGWVFSVSRRADPRSAGILSAAAAEELYRGLTDDQRRMVDSWERHFTAKYPQVAVPVVADDASALAQVLRTNLMS